MIIKQIVYFRKRIKFVYLSGSGINLRVSTKINFPIPEITPVETPENRIIEKPIIAKKRFIVTTSGGGYCRVRSPSHRCGNSIGS